MAAKGGCIDFMFLGPLTLPLDPLLNRSTEWKQKCTPTPHFGLINKISISYIVRVLCKK